MKRIDILGDIAVVTLTRGMTAIIDVTDAPVIGRWRWHVKSNRRGGPDKNRKEAFYAVRTSRAGGRRKEILMHSLIFGPVDSGLVIDHDDGNTLNNRRSNLNGITQAQNRRKSTATQAKIAKGLAKSVYFSKREQKYYAILHLGSFATHVEAEESLRSASAIVFGPSPQTKRAASS